MPALCRTDPCPGRPHPAGTPRRCSGPPGARERSCPLNAAAPAPCCHSAPPRGCCAAPRGAAVPPILQKTPLVVTKLCPRVWPRQGTGSQKCGSRRAYRGPIHLRQSLFRSLRCPPSSWFLNKKTFVLTPPSSNRNSGKPGCAGSRSVGQEASCALPGSKSSFLPPGGRFAQIRKMKREVFGK